MLIKVCGMADAQNAQEVAGLCPDMMGFIFYRPSPRNAFDLPAEVVRALPGNIKRTGVFVDEGEDEILRTAQEYGLDHLQLHGSESPGTCTSLGAQGYKIIKAFGVSSPGDLERTEDYGDACDLFVFDTKTPLRGGSGLKFDHTLLKRYNGSIPFLLSGGIGPEDAGKIDISPYSKCAGFDLNSRFETRPGLKDVGKLKMFIETTRKNRTI